MRITGRLLLVLAAITAFQNCSPFSATSAPGTNLSSEALGGVSPERLSCQIIIPDCPLHPEVRGLLDDSPGATGAEKCLSRAADFQAWCGADGGVEANFYTGTKLTDRRRMPPQGFEAGGSNYVASDLGTFVDRQASPLDLNSIINDLLKGLNPKTTTYTDAQRSAVTPQAIQEADTFKHVLFTYDEDPQLVRNQLSRMCSAGQRKIALIAWVVPSDSLARDKQGAFALVVDGQMSPRIQANIATLVQLISSLTDPAGLPCYNELQFRFAPFGDFSPLGWDTWKEANFSSYWKLIKNIRGIVEANAKPTLRRVYDLAAEHGGMQAANGLNDSNDHGQTERFLKTLWQSYYSTYGKDDSYGFSVAIAPNRLWKLLSTFDQVGVRPDEVGLDVYGAEAFSAGLGELAASDYRGRVLVQETFADLSNHPERMTDPNATLPAEIRKRALQNGFFLRSIMQWPLYAGSKSTGFSVAVESAYSSMLPAPIISNVRRQGSDQNSVEISGAYLVGPCSTQMFGSDGSSLGGASTTCANGVATFNIPAALASIAANGFWVRVTNHYDRRNDAVFVPPK